MGSVIAILLFSVSLILCLLLNFSVVYALIVGYIIFITYGLIKGYDLKVLVKKSFEGVLTVKNILLVFVSSVISSAEVDIGEHLSPKYIPLKTAPPR